MSELRARQRAVARQTIVDACADLITERRHLDFSMKEVAERAGVSLRTVYNHFATREDLLDALGHLFDERMADVGGASSRDVSGRAELLDAVRRNHSAFEQLGGISEAFAQLPLADVGIDADRAARTERIVDLIVDLMPSVPADEAHDIALVLRHLLSHRSWFWLTHEYGLSTADATAIVTWAMETLIDAAEAGDGPVPREDA
ncbi:MAG: TetR/AcrR family transcriptional regulator [Acidimicrobiales bacterium]|nr:TetR/AcrR family transcriptional regulator [Acidimicrobiales bacterium]